MVEWLPNMQQSPVLDPQRHGKLNMVADICNSCIQEVETGRLEIQGNNQLHRKFGQCDCLKRTE